ncbi:acyl carrier protein [Undibacterium sp. TJN19]|uniref:acyl carrier protein n=1 Tax=Undibacterium sp. TJN19 TaxID=3413055 RepID=UPI003BF029FA
MNQAEIKDVIVSLFKESENFKSIGLDDDYYALGVSSLTIVGMQIRVEEKLGITIDTSQLMALATMNEWVQAYVEKSRELVDQA